MAGALLPIAGVVSVYPKEMRPTAQFEPAEDGQTWNVNGCCGGGCFVVEGMKFCPFCAASLASEQELGHV